MLVTITRYRNLTGDDMTDDAQVTARIEEAQALIEDEYDRPLESEERTETCRLHPDLRVYPRATPITDIATDGVTIEDSVTLLGATADEITGWPTFTSSTFPVATVTYTGGWTSGTVPAWLARAICDLAAACWGPSGTPAGATSVRLGDAAVTYSRPTDGLDAIVPGITARLRRLRTGKRLQRALA